MKEKIYTIPLTDAFSEDCECAFCSIEKRLEKEAIEYTLGAAMMEPDFRIESNRYGYCRRHYGMLYDGGNVLSLALILQTHLDEVIGTVGKTEFTGEAVSMFKKNDKETKKAQELVSELQRITEDCLVCKRVGNTVDRYMDTFFYLWEKEEEFQSKVMSGKGFCLEHYRKILSFAPEKLGKNQLNEFLKSMHQIQIKHLKRLKEEIDWFTQKFDYRNQNAPWNNSKDAPVRLLEKLSKFI